jgi:hypothetical protein
MDIRRIHRRCATACCLGFGKVWDFYHYNIIPSDMCDSAINIDTKVVLIASPRQEHSWFAMTNMHHLHGRRLKQVGSCRLGWHPDRFSLKMEHRPDQTQHKGFWHTVGELPDGVETGAMRR